MSKWGLTLLLAGIMAFWVAAVVIGIAVGIWNNQNADRSRTREEPEWRDGLKGWLYCYDTRVAPYFYDED